MYCIYDSYYTIYLKKFYYDNNYNNFKNAYYIFIAQNNICSDMQYNGIILNKNKILKYKEWSEDKLIYYAKKFFLETGHIKNHINTTYKEKFNSEAKIQLKTNFKIYN